MSLQDQSGFGETYTWNGCYVVRYENGKEVEAWGPYSTEQRSENARKRIRRGDLNAQDKRLHLPDGIAYDAGYARDGSEA